LQILQQEKSLQRGPHQIKALVLTPTRELAIQIEESFKAYGKHLGLKHLVIFGGVSQVPQVNALRQGVDILIATPGRLLDLMNQRYISLQHINMFVLDEADRMLDMGFIHDIKKIITKLPAKRQTLFFSATMPPEIAKLSSSILNNPARVEVTPVSSTVEKIEQGIFHVDNYNKHSLLFHVRDYKSIKSVLIITCTKHGADKVVKHLKRSNIQADAIHGNKSQNARQRALTMFKNGQLKVLVATDIAARGIDVDDLSLVINFELPNVPETYVHRIGRTGRAGASGVALSFCDAEEKAFLKDIQKLIARNLPVITDHPYHLSPSARPVVNTNAGMRKPAAHQSYRTGRKWTPNRRVNA